MACCFFFGKMLQKTAKTVVISKRQIIGELILVVAMMLLSRVIRLIATTDYEDQTMVDTFTLQDAPVNLSHTMLSLSPGVGFWDAGMQKLICGDSIFFDDGMGSGAIRIGSIGVVYSSDNARTQAEGFESFMKESFMDTYERVYKYANKTGLTQGGNGGTTGTGEGTEDLPVADGHVICVNPTTVDNLLSDEGDGRTGGFIARDVQDYVDNTFIQTFKSEEELEAHITSTEYVNSVPVLAVVVFDEADEDADLKYRIRFNTSFFVNDYENKYVITADTQAEDELRVGYFADFYANNIATLLQYHVETFFGARKIDASPMDELHTNSFFFVPFPIAAYVDDPLLLYAEAGIQLIFGFCLLTAYSNIVSNIVADKTSGVREALKVIGVSDIQWQFGFYVYYLVFFILTAILVTGISTPPLFPNSSGGIMFFLHLFHGWALLSFGLFVSSLLNNPKYAGLSAFGAFFAQNAFLNFVTDSTPHMMKVVYSVFPSVAYWLSLKEALELEHAFIGVTSDNVFKNYSGYSFATGLFMLLFQCVLYTILGIYLNQIIPSKYGVAKPCCFCCGPRKKVYFGVSPEINKYDNEFIEKIPDEISSRQGIKIEGLTKVFKKKQKKGAPLADSLTVRAVDDVCLQMYEGEIFVLLGHNGAGKSTTLNMLTGLLDASAGDTYMYDMSMKKQMKECRKIMGLCPQHDVIIPDFTVKEHLNMWGSIKAGGALEGEELAKVVNASIEEVQLQAAANQKAKTLSGGQKRRLCLAMALIGDSKVVFLDEPTSGVDPASRRFIWDLLLKKKHDRVIILTTHFMDEADQLADRIAIMHHGKVQCCGSPLFLKQKYGVGYQLTVTTEEGQAAARQSILTGIIREHVPDAKEDNDVVVSSELNYRMKLTDSVVFPKLLKQLDSTKEVLNYGLSATTMEEVFIKVAKNEEESKEKVEENPAPVAIELQPNVNVNNSVEVDIKSRDGAKSKNLVVDEEFMKGSMEHRTWGRQYSALIKKRVNVWKRDKVAIFCQNLCPLVLLIFGLLNPGVSGVGGDFHIMPITAHGTRGFNTPLPVPVCPASESNNMASFLQVDDDLVNVVDVEASCSGCFAEALLDMRNDYKEAMFGAYYEPTETDMNATLYSSFTEANTAYWMQNQIDLRVSIIAGSLYSDIYSYFAENIGDFTDFGEFWAAHPTGFATSPGVAELAAMDAHESGAYMTMIFTNSTAKFGIETFLHNFMSSKYDMSVNYGVQNLPKTQQEQIIVNLVNGSIISLFLSWALAIIPPSFVGFIIKEKQVGSKHLQRISGVSMTAYWTSNFSFDVLSYLVPYTAMVVMLLISNLEIYKGQNIVVMVVAMLLYGASMIPFTYILTTPMKKTAGKQGILTFFNIFFGSILALTIVILGFIESTKDAAKALKWVFRLIPIYTVTDVFLTVSNSGLLEEDASVWDIDVCGAQLIMLAGEAVVYFVLVLMLDLDMLKCTKSKKSSQMKALLHSGENSALDEDVIAEQQRVINGNASADLIRAEGLVKKYNKKTVVNNLYFGIPRGECFGYLGVNGAGKTTSIKMLCGDVSISAGEGFLCDKNVSTEFSQARMRMGYCPQFDALHELLTAEETLLFYGRLRGVPEENLQLLVATLCERLSLSMKNQHKRPCGTYSGGNKRKLSVAISLIGSPPVVFLDEPSTGMDPVSRRFMWKFITETMRDRAVVLTTHSMEECEAMCSRIGILVAGQLECLGTSQHLKSKFGSGYQIDITSGNEKALVGIKDFLGSTFDKLVEIEVFGGKAKYRVELKGNMTLADLFVLLESKKQELGIVEYSVGQTTLEQIFINFTKKNEDIQQII